MPGATAAATRAPGRRGASTIGRALETSSVRSTSPSSTSARAACSSRAISANGRSSRRLRRAQLGAPPRRWPRRRRGDSRRCPSRRGRRRRPAARGGGDGVGGRRTAIGAPPASSSCTAGPQTGHAFGWAWKRRSPGSSYSRLAGRAHREPGHRRGRPVVGHAAHDREAGAAIRAVDERVAEAAVGRVPQLGEAVVAGRGVRRDRARPRSPRETLSTMRKSRSPVDSQRGRSRLARPPPAAATRSASRARKLSTASRPPVDLEHDPALVVEHESRRAAPRARGGRRTGESRRPARRPPPARARAAGRHGAPSSTQFTQQVRGAWLAPPGSRDVLRAS